MKCLKRNQTQFWYCLYDRKEPIYDEHANETGESLIIYGEPVQMCANISPATGAAQTEQFGNLESYDKVIVTDDMDCPIAESSVLFIDKAPEYSDGVIIGYEEPETVLGTGAPIVYEAPKHDYIVKRVAKSLNSISIAVRKVDVS